MVVRWGRKGVVAGAYAVAFVTAVAVVPTTTVKKVQIRPDVRQEVRHVTPTAVVPVDYIQRAYIRPDERFEFKHVTPVTPTVAPTVTPYDNVGNEDLSTAIMRDDREVIELVQMVLQSGLLDE